MEHKLAAYRFLIRIMHELPLSAQWKREDIKKSKLHKTMGEIISTKLNITTILMNYFWEISL